jgi:hypothetical protein
MTRIRPAGLEPATYGLEVNEPIDVTTDGQTLTTTQDPRGTTKGTKPDEPIAPDATLADLVGDGTAALDSILPPDIRFVVNNWPDLPEDTQRAILAIVRAAGSQADGSKQDRPDRSTKAIVPGSGEPLFWATSS